jgi:hypothetical protein
MLREQFNLLSPVVGVLLLLMVLVLYVYYTTARHYRIKLLLGPALLAACVFAVPAVGARLGYGWPAPLPESFQYVGHRTVIAGGEKHWIDVMLVSRQQAGAEPRLHRVHWSRKMEEALERAERMKEGREGGDIVLSRPSRAKGAGGGDADAGYSARRVLPSDATPKGPLPAPGLPGGQPQDQPATPRSLRPNVIA